MARAPPETVSPFCAGCNGQPDTTVQYSPSSPRPPRCQRTVVGMRSLIAGAGRVPDIV